MGDKPKKAMGKLYEKFRIIKEFPSQLDVAVAHNSENGQEEIWLVWSDPKDPDKKMPLAHIMTDTEMSTKITPDFTRSFILSTLWQEYKRFDTRLTVEEMDDYLEVDESYNQMVETYDGAIKLADDTLNGFLNESVEDMFVDLEEMLKQEE